MPVLSRCPMCRAVMPESRTESRCPRCGELVLPAQRKLCATCGDDITRQKRVRDTVGEYFCQDCWATRLAASGEEPGYACNTCGNVFATDQVYQDGDGAICFDCYAKREMDPNALIAAAAESTDAEATPFTPSPSFYQKPSGPPWGLIALCGGLLVALVVILVVISMR